jgi:Basic region leucine zipper
MGEPQPRSGSAAGNDAAAAAAAALARGVDDALAILLRHPENDWARDFVLAPDADPAGDVAMLANPVAFAHAVAGASSGVGIPSPSRNTADQLFSSVDYVMIPAWSQRSIAVGIAVFRINDVLCSLTGLVERARFAIGRYVKDLRTLETLFVSRSVDHPTRLPRPSAITSIYSQRFTSAAQRTHFHAFCDPVLFAAGRYVESVQLSATGTLFRDCPICCKPPECACGCQLSTINPKSSLDFSTLMPCALMHSGTYRGCLEIFLRCFRTGSTSGFSFPGTDWCRVDRGSSVADSLRQFAIRNTIGHGNPRRAAIPTTLEGLPSDIFHFLSTQALGHEAPMQRETGYMPEEITDEIRVSRSLTFEAPSKPSELDLQAFDAAAANLFETVLKSAPGAQLDDDSTKADGAAPNILKSGRGHCGKAGRAVRSGTAPSDAEIITVLGKEALRRAKNRASAARSNARKKAYFETLEQQVCEMREKLQELRARQSALLFSNRRLTDHLSAQRNSSSGPQLSEK